MIEAARRFYVERHGEDHWLDVLHKEMADMLIARAEAERIRRQTPPDYARLTPQDLQIKVQEALGASNEH